MVHLLTTVLALAATATATLTYSDNHVLPTPEQSYQRYLTLFGNGTRGYTCDPSSKSNEYHLTDLNYNMYTNSSSTELVGRRVFLTTPDVAGGDLAFYTKFGAFTYWVGKVVKTHSDDASTGPLDLPTDLELVTERSEPKYGQAVLDLGLADFVTRFGARGGALPEGTKCTPATKKVTVSGTAYYSFWKRIE